jgi:hypothetical protein
VQLTITAPALRLVRKMAPLSTVSGLYPTGTEQLTKALLLPSLLTPSGRLRIWVSKTGNAL